MSKKFCNNIFISVKITYKFINLTRLNFSTLFINITYLVLLKYAFNIILNIFIYI